MRLKRIYISIAMIAAGLAVQALLASPVSAAYVSQGTATSTNLLSGSSASSITNFHYNIATLPATFQRHDPVQQQQFHMVCRGRNPGRVNHIEHDGRGGFEFVRFGLVGNRFLLQNYFEFNQ